MRPADPVKKLAYRQNRNILLDAHRGIYFYIPKVACTSLKTVFARVLGLFPEETGPGAPVLPGSDERERHYAVHEIDFPSVPLSQIHQGRYRNYFSFCFVRNPWDRLVSCYSDKIHPDPAYGDRKFRDGVFRPFHKFGRFTAGMSFDDFVRAVAAIPDEQADVHFRSQCCFVCDRDGLLLPGFVGRFERLAEDFAHVSGQLRLPEMDLPFLKRSRRRSPTAFYDPVSAEIVRRRYARDIALFHYEFPA